MSKHVGVNFDHVMLNSWNASEHAQLPSALAVIFLKFAVCQIYELNYPWGRIYRTINRKVVVYMLTMWNLGMQGQL